MRRYLWRGDAAAKISAITQIVVAAFAVATSVLSVTGVASITSATFRAVALSVGGVILVAQLVASEQWHEQADLLSRLRKDVRTHVPDRVESIVATKIAATSEAGVREVAPARIEAELRELLTKSSGWIFQGGSGRWLRSTTLPHLARLQNADVPVTALLLDPREELLCLEWVKSDYSRRYNEKSSPPTVPRAIQTNILATIYSLGWYGVYSRILPKAVLLHTFSSQRYDVGTTGLVISVATRNEPAIYAQKGSWFYETVCLDLTKASDLNPTVELPQEGIGQPLLYPPLNEVSGPTVFEALRRTAILDGPGASQPLLDRYSDPNGLDFEAIARDVRQPARG